MICVLDACALLSCLNDEPGSDIVDNLLVDAIDGKIAIYMNIVNLIEVHYANAIALATAIELSSQFVTSDHHELEAVAENESIPFLWLPSHPKK